MEKAVVCAWAHVSEGKPRDCIRFSEGSRLPTPQCLSRTERWPSISLCSQVPGKHPLRGILFSWRWTKGTFTLDLAPVGIRKPSLLSVTQHERQAYQEAAHARFRATERQPAGGARRLAQLGVSQAGPAQAVVLLSCVPDLTALPRRSPQQLTQDTPLSVHGNGRRNWDTHLKKSI